MAKHRAGRGYHRSIGWARRLLMVQLSMVAVLVGCWAVTAMSSPVGANFSGTTSSGVTFAASSSFYRDTVLQDDPVGYWRLSDSGATAVDIAAGNSGTFENGPQLGVPGRSADGDTAVRFDGVDDSVQVDHQYSFTGQNPFSAELLYKADSQSGTVSRSLLQQYLFETPPGGYSWKGWSAFVYPQGGAWKFYLMRCSGIELEGQCDYAWSGTALQPGLWYHLAATYDGTTMRVFVNGSPDGQGTSTRSLPSISDPFRIGWDETDYPTLDGTIDEVALFDYALSATRIQAHAARAA